jgi:cell wall-associated NlpC family hydrolase
MNKFTTPFALFLLIESVMAVSVHAERLSHRPWMAHRRNTASAVELESDRTHLSTRTPAKSKGDRIAQQAKRYRGTRYRFGGDSKFRGFDCSGLVRRIYNDLHLDKLPRTSRQLYRMGDPVHLNELRPGDLVFFKNTYKRGVSHVGVYAGNNHFIHAQNRRHGVTVTSLAEPYYQLHYAGARRLY